MRKIPISQQKLMLVEQYRVGKLSDPHWSAVTQKRFR